MNPAATPKRRPEIPIGIDPGSELTGTSVDDLSHKFKALVKSPWESHASDYNPAGLTYVQRTNTAVPITVDVSPASNAVWAAAKGGVLGVSSPPRFVKQGKPIKGFQHYLVGFVRNGHPKYYTVIGHFRSDMAALGTPSVQKSLGMALVNRR